MLKCIEGAWKKWYYKKGISLQKRDISPVQRKMPLFLRICIADIKILIYLQFLAISISINKPKQIKNS